MPKPFPFPLAIATDICSVPRIQKLLTGNNGTGFIRRLLTPDERAQNKARCDDAYQKWKKFEDMKELHAWKSKKQPGTETGTEKAKKVTDEVVADHLRRMIEKDQVAAEEGLRGVATFLAGRFAAKEAIIKAHERHLTFHDIIIRRPPDDRTGSKAPIAIVLPEDGEMEDGQEVKISISHDTDYATAVCLAPTEEGLSAIPNHVPIVRRRLQNIPLVDRPTGHHSISVGDVQGSGRAWKPADDEVSDHQDPERVRPDFRGLWKHAEYKTGNVQCPETVGPSFRTVWKVADDETSDIQNQKEETTEQVSDLSTASIRNESHTPPKKPGHFPTDRTIRVDNLPSGLDPLKLRNLLARKATALHVSPEADHAFISYFDVYTAVRQGANLYANRLLFGIQVTYLGDNTDLKDVCRRFIIGGQSGREVDSDGRNMASKKQIASTSGPGPDNEVVATAHFIDTKPDHFPDDRTIRVEGFPAELGAAKLHHAFNRSIDAHIAPGSKYGFVLYPDAYMAMFAAAKSAYLRGGLRVSCLYLGGDIDITVLYSMVIKRVDQPYDGLGLQTHVKEAMDSAFESAKLAALLQSQYENSQSIYFPSLFKFRPQNMVQIEGLPSHVESSELAELRDSMEAITVESLPGIDCAFAAYSKPLHALWVAVKYDGFCTKSGHSIKCTYMGPRVDMRSAREIVNRPALRKKQSLLLLQDLFNKARVVKPAGDLSTDGALSNGSKLEGAAITSTHDRSSPSIPTIV